NVYRAIVNQVTAPGRAADYYMSYKPSRLVCRCPRQYRTALRGIWYACAMLLCFGMPALGHGTGGGGGGGGNTHGWDYNNPEPDAPPFDETSVFVNVQRVGGMELPGVIKDRMVLLPVTNLFDFLKIRNTPSLDLDSVTGYFIDPAATFCIDYIHSRITYMGKVSPLQPGDM